jgi:hypothetical protein
MRVCSTRRRLSPPILRPSASDHREQTSGVDPRLLAVRLYAAHAGTYC